MTANSALLRLKYALKALDQHSYCLRVLTDVNADLTQRYVNAINVKSYLNETREDLFIHIIYDVPNFLMLHETMQPEARNVLDHFPSCGVKGSLLPLVFPLYLSQFGQHFFMDLQTSSRSTQEWDKVKMHETTCLALKHLSMHVYEASTLSRSACTFLS